MQPLVYGGEGTIELANEVVKLADQDNSFKCLYDDNISLFNNFRTSIENLGEEFEILDIL